MAPMDDTPLDRMITELESADPAEAPDAADAGAQELARRLDSGDEEAGAASEA